MSHPRLPQEISDCIVDLLQNEHQTLKQCCLVSKSWLPRARKNLFAMIRFESPTDPAAWVRTFPDPANSPGYLARSLEVACVADFAVAIVGNRDWIQSFSNVVQLEIRKECSTTPLIRTFEIVCALPLLEDLNIIGRDICYHRQTPPFRPPTSPPLTGSLSLRMRHGMAKILSTLLDLPNGVRFRRFACAGRLRLHLRRMVALVDACSQTLESIDIGFEPLLSPSSWGDSIDLSKTTKLKEVVLRSDPHYVEWITAGLRTITSTHKDFQEVSLIIPFLSIPIGKDFGEYLRIKWADLDHVLAQLCQSHHICVKLTCITKISPEVGERVSEFVGGMLPETTKEGAIVLADNQVD